jgi:hypothetical protein
MGGARLTLMGRGVRGLGSRVSGLGLESDVDWAWGKRYTQNKNQEKHKRIPTLTPSVSIVR